MKSTWVYTFLLYLPTDVQSQKATLYILGSVVLGQVRLGQVGAAGPAQAGPVGWGAGGPVCCKSRSMFFLKFFIFEIFEFLIFEIRKSC